MRNRERGIGNLPFIAVLVLFVVAVALFFMKQDEFDTEHGKRVEFQTKLNASFTRVNDLQNAYEAIKGVVGINDAALNVTTEAVPAPAAITKALRSWIHTKAQELAKASEATLKTTHYTVTGTKITPQAGDTVQVQFFTPPLGEENWTFAGFIAPLAASMQAAARIAVENNDKFDSAKKGYDGDVKTMREQNVKADTDYKADVSAKQQASDAQQVELGKIRTANTELAAKIDTMSTKNSQDSQTWAKEKRKLERNVSALETRLVNEKIVKDLALKEDPIDGSVVAVSETLGTVWINLGTKHKLSRGTRFTVWRAGKGNSRENIATVTVINVDKTRAEARIIRRLNARVHPTAGMSVSNPFYDPKGTLVVHIYGDLKNYPTDIAARRLAASGAKLSRSLDDTVNVIVLGEPPRAGDQEAPEDDAEAATAMKKAAMERSKRLTWVMEQARAIGAIVVTEDVLATFIDY